MRKFVIVFMLTFSFAAYNVGQTISITDQSLEREVCAGTHYEVGDTMSLLDLNGAENGGDYHVFFIDMSATWWGPCYTSQTGPVGSIDSYLAQWLDVDGDGNYDYEDYADNIVTLSALSDLNQPYSCQAWGDLAPTGHGDIVHDVGYGMHTLYNSGNAFPSFVFIDHTMTVYDKSNGAGTWSTKNKITEMLNACIDDGFCGSCSGTLDSDGDGLDDECDDCYNNAGDINEDATIDILDVVGTVNIILNGGLNSPNASECQLSNANYNGDSLINVLDIIQIINAILGQGLSSNHVVINSPAYTAFDIIDNNLKLNISSVHDFTGVELSFYTDRLLPVSITSSRSDIQLYSDLFNGIQKVLIFSMDNLPFSFNELNILIEDGVLLSHDDLDVVVASKEGQQIPVVYNVVESKSFKIENSYPNPFNPSTNLTYQVEKAGDLKVVVHNILGQQVAELYNGYQTYGSHSLTWDASNMSSGVYYITLELNGQFENSKVMLIK